MPISPDKIKFLLILAKKSRKITGKFFPVVLYFTWKLELVSDIYNLRYLHKQKSLLFSWGLDTNWKFMVILWTLNRGLGLILLKKLDYLLDICMLTQGCYPLGTQPRFWLFYLHKNVITYLMSRYWLRVVILGHSVEVLALFLLPCASFLSKYLCLKVISLSTCNKPSNFISIFSESLAACCFVCFVMLL